MISKTQQRSETRCEFERRYVADFPRATFGEDGNMIAMTCTCDDGGGPTHWAAIDFDRKSILAHQDHERILAELRK